MKANIKRLSKIEWYQAISELAEADAFVCPEWCSAIVKYLGGDVTPIIISHPNLQPLFALVYTGGPWSAPGCFRLGAIGYGGPYPFYTQYTSRALDAVRLKGIVFMLEESLGGICSGLTTSPDKAWSHFPENLQTQTQILRLSGVIEDIYNYTITANIRTCIRKAQNQGVIVRSLEEKHLQHAYPLLADTQHRVGATYVTSEELFYELGTGMGGMSLAVGAFAGEEIIAASVFLLFRKSVFHLLNGWSKEYGAWCPNQAILWHLIRTAVQNRCTSLNLGESHSSSLFETKARWGGEVVPLIRIQGNVKDVLNQTGNK